MQFNYFMLFFKKMYKCSEIHLASLSGNIVYTRSAYRSGCCDGFLGQHSPGQNTNVTEKKGHCFMLLLDKAFVIPDMMDPMNDLLFSYSDHLSFPVEVFDEQDHICVDEDKIKFICGKIICDAGFRTGRLGVVLADNVAMHALNHKYLKHDYVTDVIGFPLDCNDSHLEAETVVSAEVAKERCEEFGWDDESELLLYVIHGTLHQVGYDDYTESEAKIMRQKEAYYLRLLGIIVNPEDEYEN